MYRILRMKKQEKIYQEKNNQKRENQRGRKTTLTDWLVKTMGASALAGLCALHGGSDGREVYQNLQTRKSV